MTRRPHGALEAKVAAALAGADQPLTPADVRDRLGGDGSVGLAYSTVVTVLTRMYEKGLLDRTKVGRSFVYSRIADPAQLAARKMRHMLDGRQDRDAVLSHFVGDLATSDAALLRRMLGLSEDPAEGERS